MHFLSRLFLSTLVMGLSSEATATTPPSPKPLAFYEDDQGRTFMIPGAKTPQQAQAVVNQGDYMTSPDSGSELGRKMYRATKGQRFALTDSLVLESRPDGFYILAQEDVQGGGAGEKAVARLRVQESCIQGTVEITRFNVPNSGRPLTPQILMPALRVSTQRSASPFA